MKYTVALFVLQIFNLSGISLQAQLKIDGKIIDTNGQPIPSVYVLLTSSQTGTITNQDGEFSLLANSEQDSVLISHISYENQKLKLGFGFHELTLKPKTTILREVIVSDYAGQSVHKAFIQAMDHIKEKKYGKGFYRQITTNDSIPTEILESFYALETSCSGIDKESIEEARYAIKKKENKDQLTINFSNFSGFVTASKIVSEQSSKEKSILIPIMPNSRDFYDFVVSDEFELNNVEYLRVHFKPAIGCLKPAVEGDLVLNSKTFKIVRMDFSIQHSLGTDYIKTPSGKIWKTFNHLVTMNYDFREEGSSVILNYIQARQSFEFLNDANETHRVSVQALLIVFQQGLKKIKRLEDVTLKKDDLAELKKKKYNASFWKENRVVKRTPLEEQIIAGFEKAGSFGTMFNSPNTP